MKKMIYFVMIFGLLCTLMTACSDINTQPVTEAQTETQIQLRDLTLDDVIALSEKKDALTMDDFAEFNYTEVGSGIYIRLYPIDNDFDLMIGSAYANEEPMYMYLNAKDGSDEYIDIRTGNTTAFIHAHTTQTVTTE